MTAGSASTDTSNVSTGKSGKTITGSAYSGSADQRDDFFTTTSDQPAKVKTVGKRRDVKVVHLARTVDAVGSLDADTLARRSLTTSERTPTPRSSVFSVAVLDRDTPVEELTKADGSERKFTETASVAPTLTAAVRVGKEQGISKQQAKLDHGKLKSTGADASPTPPTDTCVYETVPGAAGSHSLSDDKDQPLINRRLIAKRRRYYFSDAQRWINQQCCSENACIILIVGLILLIFFLLGFVGGFAITHNIYLQKCKAMRYRGKKVTC